MSYYFIEDRYPIGDPNTDLNFENDILYSTLLDDDLDKHNIPYKNANVISRKKTSANRQTTNTESDYSGTNIYVLFLLIVVLCVIIWHIYNANASIKTSLTVYDTNPFTADLVQYSPAIDGGLRYI